MTELKITIPEGMEIDTDNSVLTGDNPIIKFKPKTISYENIMKDCKETHYCTKNGSRISAVDSQQAKKLVAIKQLMNIASYYNARRGGVINWKDINQNKYHIIFTQKEYRIDINTLYNFGSVYFINIEDTQAVIDNPNFTSILDTIFKD